MKKNILFLTILLTPFLCFADKLEFPSIFSNMMVLQQGQEVPVWGKGKAGAEISVSFAGQTKTSTVAEDGSWQLSLAPLSASKENREMSISMGEEQQTITNVLVGEVWLCSGQSNMEFTLGHLSRNAREPADQPVADYVKNETETASDPLLRHFKVNNTTSPFEPLSNVKGTWISSNPASNMNFSGTAYFFGKELRQQLDVPVALINSSWGGTRVEAWTPDAAIKANENLKVRIGTEEELLKNRIAQWDPVKQKELYENRLKIWQEKTGNKGRKPRQASHPAASPQNASSLFNAMIHPLVPYAFKGAIWYQGESNAKEGYAVYSETFMAMIQSWRDYWQQGDFPFYFVQLASFRAPAETPVDSDPWVTVLDQQRRSLALKNTGMAVANDIGEAKDVHPRNKIDIGKRLSLWALANEYGKNLVKSGPLYKSHRINGNNIEITFDHVGSGLMVARKNLLDPAQQVEEALAHFQICAADGVWKWAEAKITGKDKVSVSHADIAAPTVVRYAWSPNPEKANLYNKEGLPTSVFTTEK